MQHLLWEQPAQQYSRNQSTELRSQLTVALHVKHGADQNQEERDLEYRIDGQRLPSSYARLSKFALCIPQPTVAARYQADEVKKIVQESAAAPPGLIRHSRDGMRLQFLQAIGQRILAVTK